METIQALLAALLPPFFLILYIIASDLHKEPKKDKEDTCPDVTIDMKEPFFVESKVGRMGLMGRMSRMGPIGLIGPMRPMGLIGLIGPIGPMRPMRPIGLIGPIRPMVELVKR